MKIGINRFVRIGRLALRISWQRKDIKITHINEKGGDSFAASHLLEFDSINSRWNKNITSNNDEIIVEAQKIALTSKKNYLDIPWKKSSVDLILECTGKNKNPEYLKGILRYEERPLVSTDYLNDSRSSIIDRLSPMVVNSNLLKVYAWYDNELLCSSRFADLNSKFN